MPLSALWQLETHDTDVLEIVCIHQQWPVLHNTWSYVEQPRPNDGIIYICKGRAVYTTPDGEKTEGVCGDLLFLPRNSRYFVELTPGSESMLLNFSLYEHAERLTVSDTVFGIGTEKNGFVRDTLELLCRLYAGSANALSIKANVYALLDYAISMKTQSKADAVLVYINNHLSESHSIPDIAKGCAMSESSFRRLVIEKTGLSPIRYIAGQKIVKAKQLLAVDELSVEEIASILGFYDSAHFIKCFKKETGQTPAQYRKKDREA